MKKNNYLRPETTILAVKPSYELMAASGEAAGETYIEIEDEGEYNGPFRSKQQNIWDGNDEE